MKCDYFECGNYVVRKHNNALYRVVGVEDANVYVIVRYPRNNKPCFTYEVVTNLRKATETERKQGYAEVF